jgi:hypothetical protein
MISAQIASDKQRINATYSVRFTLAPGLGRLDCEWSPHMPSTRKQRLLMPKYLKARNMFLAGASAQLGINIMCVEVQF